MPLFGDIPVLGWLFRNSTLNNVKTSLVIFLKPHIVHNAGDLAEIYRRKIKERDIFLDSVGEGTDPDDDFYSLLPRLEEGEYHSDTVDEMERRKLEEMRRELYEIIRDESNSGYPLRLAPEEPQVVEPPVVEPQVVEPQVVEPAAEEADTATEDEDKNEAEKAPEGAAAATGTDDTKPQTRPVP